MILNPTKAIFIARFFVEILAPIACQQFSMALKSRLLPGQIKKWMPDFFFFSDKTALKEWEEQEKYFHNTYYVVIIKQYKLYNKIM